MSTIFRSKCQLSVVRCPLPVATSDRCLRQRTTDNGQRTTGFTLVEMLVVITIIGILVALSSVAVFKALTTAKLARIKAEVTNIESALQQMKTQYGDYPPSDFSGDLTDPLHPVRRFMSKAFPRILETDMVCWTPLMNVNGAGKPLTPAQALCFWLRGFSPDVTHPITGAGDRKPFFDFDASRLYDASAVIANPTQPASDGPYTQGSSIIPVYKPQGSKVPYVYFSAHTYLTQNQSIVTANKPTYGAGSGVCIPYMWDSNGDGTIDVKDYDTNNNGKLDVSEQSKLYANPKSFQIISGSLDSDYGTAPATSTKTFPLSSGSLTVSQSKTYPTGSGYDASGADDDNIANFSRGTTLEDDKP